MLFLCSHGSFYEGSIHTLWYLYVSIYDMHLHTHNCLVPETFLPVVFIDRSDLLEFQNIRSAFIHSNLIMAGLTICSSCLSKSVYESTINHALICDTSQRCAVITGTGDLINRGVVYTDLGLKE